MVISLDQLMAASRRPRREVASTLKEARDRQLRTAFLCHSHKDAVYVDGLLVLLREAGWSVYVDWKDRSMPAVPDESTGAIIRQRISQADFFLFLATPNALVSRWCPWEIGIADGRKPNERIYVIPTRSGQTYYGNEYLGLYRRIEESSQGPLAAWRPKEDINGTLVRDL